MVRNMDRNCMGNHVTFMNGGIHMIEAVLQGSFYFLNIISNA